MNYTFFCPLCRKTYQKDIKMSEYDKEKDRQICTNCNTRLKRVIEFEGSVGTTGGYDAVAGKASWQ